MSGKRSHISSKSAIERAKEFPDDFYEDSGYLFCKYCQKSISFDRVSTIRDHVKSDKHDALKRKATQGEPNDESQAPLPKRQTTINKTFNNASTSKELRDNVIDDFVLALISANIPLQKADNPVLKGFLMKHVRNGGSIASAATLRERIPAIYEKHMCSIEESIAGKSLYVIVDETTDARAKMVLNILVCLPVVSQTDKLKSFLVESVMLDAVNATSVGGEVVRCLAVLGVPYQKVKAFVTDGARYMKACFRDVVKPVCTSCVHVVCLAHCMNLVGEELRKNCPDVNDFVNNMKTAFCLSAGKRKLYINQLKMRGVEDAKTPPAPVITRWYSWLEAVIQHYEYFQYYAEIMTAVQETYGV